ncbi:substrate-binding domain-containing protein [Halomonas getboli]|uniref:substrate-binding domain-containing protein n=1 Tax=Halomonas getboli TaxID=2935862 RepID=UPI00200031C1|nr:substrate-binding domain-containing protein [Halomonas getboli]MCK2184690.1 substrate-binding domain-containing protein [Halomonas getboli]
MAGCQSIVRFAGLLVVLLGMATASGAAAGTSHDTILVDDYIDRHPEQQALMADFMGRVQAPALPLTSPPRSTIRIAVIYPALQASDYWQRSLDALEARLRALGLPYRLKVYLSRPTVDVDLQARQLAMALQWRPDYLVFTLDSVPQLHMIERVLALGRPRLILQNITTPLADWESDPPFLYVGFDHVQGTRLIADWMLERAGYRGKYMTLHFSSGYVSRMRGGTFSRMAARYPELEEVASYHTDGDPEQAYRATLQTLEAHPDLKMIFAGSTDVALAALRALRETDRMDVLLNGWGGGAAELAALKDGGLDVTAMRINDDNGVAMAEAMRMVLLGQASRVPRIFAGDIALVTRDTPAEEIAELERRAFRLSGVPDAEREEP